MRRVRRWEQGEFSPQRPLVFLGWPKIREQPTTFRFRDHAQALQAPEIRNTARLYYLNGWTAIVFWNAETYFADEINTFDGMIDLVRSRFHDKFYLQAPIIRDYVD